MTTYNAKLISEKTRATEAQKAAKAIGDVNSFAGEDEEIGIRYDFTPIGRGQMLIRTYSRMCDFDECDASISYHVVPVAVARQVWAQEIKAIYNVSIYRNGEYVKSAGH